jgi:phosphotransferase system enzyme I (PtsP)
MSQFGATHESSLLLTLEEISQLVSHSHDPGETLTNIVHLIQKRFGTDVCSVYVMEADRAELVLGATIGLKAESVGQVRMRLDEGLTGLVAERMAPVMVHDAFQHPRFKYFPDAGEDPYHSFLGVPLVEGGSVQGVLVVQTTEPRTFSPNEMRMLVTVASQLAPLISEARLLERVVATAHAGPASAPGSGVSSGRGVSLSPGVGQGQAYVLNGFNEWQDAAGTRSGDSAAELTRLAAAMDAAREELIRLSQRISELVGHGHGAIMQAQLMILQDRKIERDLTGRIAAGATAEAALLQTLDQYTAVFEKLANPFFQERIYDIKDVFRRVLWHLRPGHARGAPSAASPGTEASQADRLVIVAREVSVMDLFSVDLDRLAAVVVGHGGPQSHAAILARSLGVPMIGQVRDLIDRIEPGHPLYVDGAAGVVYLDNPPDVVHAARVSAADPGHAGRVPDCKIDQPDGWPRIEANINLLYELPQAIEHGASGVGLYRSEFLFLARRTLPTEEEQVGTYRKLLSMLRGRPVSIRTFDLRPDKIAHCTHLASTAAGPLDWRLVLDSPPIQKIFREQVRAVLRAAAAGPTRLLVPLVTRTEQLDFVLESIEQAREELVREGLECAMQVPLGIMIEVAAATEMIGPWSERVDFFAVGTNDLVASALGIDRNDPVVASLNDPMHPGVLRSLHHVVESAHQAERVVTVCGEMASDPEGALALAALGVDSLSVAVRQLAATRQSFAIHSRESLTSLASALLDERTAQQARSLLRSHVAGLIAALS